MTKSSTHKGHIFRIANIIAILAIVLLAGMASASTNYTQVTIIVDKNNINLHSHEDVIVDILSSVTPQFDATTINISSVKFMGAPAKDTGNSEFDVNNDNLTDLKLHFDLRKTSIQCGGGNQWLILTGKTNDGTEIFGLNTTQILDCIVSPPDALNITGFAPLSPVNDSIGATRLFNITVNQMADVFWMINGNLVKEPDLDSHVNESDYTNYSASFGIWNVTALAINITYFNGTDIPLSTLSDSHSWDWNVSKINTIISVTSSLNPSTFGQSVTFTANVSNVSAVAPGIGTPTGMVLFNDGGVTIGTGTLNSSGQANFTTSTLSNDSHSITAVYNGDGNFSGNTSSPLIQTVDKATATITLGDLTQTYTGSPLMPTATTNPSGLSIDWTGAPQTSTGSYLVTATVNDANYTGSASGTFNITKATAIVIFGNLTQIYTGSPLTPTVSTDPAGLSIDWIGVPQTSAGSYPVTATINDTNYTGSASDTFDITKATATITLNESELTQTYDGTSKNVTATTSPLDLTGVSITYNGSSIPPIAAGSYEVVANLTNKNYSASDATGTLVINKAPASVKLSNLIQIYTGNLLTPVVSTDPSDLNIEWINAPQTAAGSYDVTATVNDPNYQGSASVTFNITKATATVTLSNMEQTYTGNPLIPTATTNPSDLSLEWIGAPQNSAGSYLVTAIVNDTNYTGEASGIFNITKESTSTAIASSANLSVFGEAVNFTATVSSAAGTPSGTVQFKIDGSDFGLPVTLVGGMAKSNDNSSLSVGTHTITAEYSGDGNFNSSVSSALTQTVNKVYTAIPTFTRTSSSAGAFSGGSGCGSGVITKENLSNIKQYETREVSVHTSGGVTVFNFTTLGIVNKAGFTAKTNEGCIAARGEVLKERPSQAATDAPGIGTVYFNIWLGPWGYGESSKIENPYVVFSVPDEKNNESVKLMMYENKSWIDLKTEKIDTGNYRAYTRGFGSFAIVETATANETPAETSTQSTPTPVVITNEPAPQKPTNLALIIVVFILILGMIIGYRRYRKGLSRKKADLQK